MSKFRNNKHEVEEFEFNQFTKKTVSSESVEDFHFTKIDPSSNPAQKIDPETIKVERELATGSNFKVDHHVQNYRGFKDQEKEEFQKKLDEALQGQYEELSQKAYVEGVALGKEEGKVEAVAQASEVLEENISKISKALEDIQIQKNQLLTDHKLGVYSILKNVAKWVALKEIKEDESVYLEKLLERLIGEINSKNNLTIKVSKETYGLMPEVIQAVENKIGSLGNVRFEVSPEITSEGIIVESQNGIIDASIEAQFAMIDSVFNQGE